MGVDLVVWDGVGPVGWSEDDEQAGCEGHADLVGLVDCGPGGQVGGACCAVDGDGGEVSEEEFFGGVRWGQDLDSPGVEAVDSDFLEESLDAEAEQPALVVQLDDAALYGLGAEAEGFGAGGLQPVLAPE